MSVTQNSDHTTKPIRLLFFLDYGCCLWPVEDYSGGLDAEDSLSLEAQRQINDFLREYDQFYFWGCPPNSDWDVQDCRRFNRECHRIFSLIESELKGRFIICNEQFDLIEDANILAEFYRRGKDFIRERMRNFYNDTEED